MTIIHRGICNGSGVSCHLSSSLQVLCHSIAPFLRCALIQVANTLDGFITDDAEATITTTTMQTSTALYFLIVLGRFFRDMTTTASSSTVAATKDSVNPTKLYQILSKVTRLDPDQVGDVSTALRTILEHVRYCIYELVSFTSANKSSHDDNENVSCWTMLSNRMEDAIWGGTYVQTLVGQRWIQQSQRDGPLVLLQQRRRKTKVRNIPCPFALPHTSKTIATTTSTQSPSCAPNSFVSVLIAATVRPKPVRGYNWNIAKDYYEEEEFVQVDGQQQQQLLLVLRNDGANDSDIVDDDKAVSTTMETAAATAAAAAAWETYQTLHFLNLPCHLVFQLQPFVYRNGRMEREQPHYDDMNIPLTFDMPKVIMTMDNDDKNEKSAQRCSGCSHWILTAAVLHLNYHHHRVEEEEDNNNNFDNEEEEQESNNAGGHYICLIRDYNDDDESPNYLTTTATASRSSCWALIDDDQVTTIQLPPLATGGDDEEEEDEQENVNLSQLLRQAAAAMQLSYGKDICPTLVSYKRACTCGGGGDGGCSDDKLDEWRKEFENKLQLFAEAFYAQHERCQQELVTEDTTTTRSVVPDWSKPNEFIGRRLRIRWAKGKFYPGTVLSYDSSSGKHRIQYDDGDVRDYCLAKKTIEWE